MYKQKSVCFYKLTQTKKKLGKNPIYNSIKKNKMLRNTLNQGSERMYTENYKTFMKVVKGDINKWK